MTAAAVCHPAAPPASAQPPCGGPRRRRTSRTRQDALVAVVVSTGDDVLLTWLLRAALTCAECAAGTTLRMLSGALPDPGTGSDSTTQPGAPTADTPATGPSVPPPRVADDNETVRFALDGQAYEIDLHRTDADRLRATLSRYVAAGRPVMRQATPATADSRQIAPLRADRRPDTGAIREWARAQGHEVSDRGRIPTKVLEAYRSAN
jgi:hypothetical protein